MNSERLVILAGGISSRMKIPAAADVELDSRLLTDADLKPKSMIGIGNDYRPFLDYLLINASKAGINDIVIVISPKDDLIKSYYLNNENNLFNNLHISYAIQYIPVGKTKPLGTADALLAALQNRPDWRGKKFAVCNSDNLYSVEAFKAVMNSVSLCAMIDYDRRALDFPQERIEGFAVTLKDKESYLCDIIEKPGKDVINRCKSKDGYIGISMNLYYLDYDIILPFLENCPFDPVRNEKELTTAVKMMIDEYPRSVLAIPFSQHVPDLTMRNDIPAVQKYISENYTLI